MRPSPVSGRGTLGRRLFAGAAMLALGGTAHAACQLQPRAVVPIRVIEGFPVIAATVGGTPVSFLLDTGAQAHLVLPQAAGGARACPPCPARSR